MKCKYVEENNNSLASLEVLFVVVIERRSVEMERAIGKREL
jgi:hypothetical protein